MLQTDTPDDYVVATGTSYSVRDFLTFCFEHAGLDWERHVRFDERYLRPAEVPDLVGDASKAERELDWKAAVCTPELARIMTEAELDALDPGARDHPCRRPVHAAADCTSGPADRQRPCIQTGSWRFVRAFGPWPPTACSRDTSVSPARPARGRLRVGTARDPGRRAGPSPDAVLCADARRVPLDARPGARPARLSRRSARAVLGGRRLGRTQAVPARSRPGSARPPPCSASRSAHSGDALGSTPTPRSATCPTCCRCPATDHRGTGTRHGAARRRLHGQPLRPVRLSGSGSTAPSTGTGWSAVCGGCPGCGSRCTAPAGEAPAHGPAPFDRQTELCDRAGSPSAGTTTATSAGFYSDRLPIALHSGRPSSPPASPASLAARPRPRAAPGGHSRPKRWEPSGLAPDDPAALHTAALRGRAWVRERLTDREALLHMLGTLMPLPTPPPIPGRRSTGNRSGMTRGSREYPWLSGDLAVAPARDQRPHRRTRRRLELRGSVFAVVLQLGYTALASRLVAPAAFGAYAIALTVTGLLGYLSLSGLGTLLLSAERLTRPLIARGPAARPARAGLGCALAGQLARIRARAGAGHARGRAAGPAARAAVPGRAARGRRACRAAPLRLLANPVVLLELAGQLAGIAVSAGLLGAGFLPYGLAVCAPVTSVTMAAGALWLLRRQDLPMPHRPPLVNSSAPRGSSPATACSSTSARRPRCGSPGHASAPVRPGTTRGPRCSPVCP